MPVFNDKSANSMVSFSPPMTLKKETKGTCGMAVKVCQTLFHMPNRLLLIKVNLVRQDLVEVFFCAFIFCLVGFFASCKCVQNKVLQA